MNRLLALGDISAIVLAGGRSLRMGQDKASLPLYGKTLLEHLVLQLEGRFKEIIVSVSRGQSYPLKKVKIVQDLYEETGPLAGILSGLSVCQTDIALVLPCDQPEPDLSLAEEMLARITDHDLVYLLLDSRIPHPLFALYRRTVMPVIQGLIQDKRLSVLELLTRVKAMGHEVPSERIRWHLNSPEDYDLYLAHLNRKRKG